MKDWQQEMSVRLLLLGVRGGRVAHLNGTRPEPLRPGGFAAGWQSRKGPEPSPLSGQGVEPAEVGLCRQSLAVGSDINGSQQSLIVRLH